MRQISYSGPDYLWPSINSLISGNDFNLYGDGPINEIYFQELLQRLSRKGFNKLQIGQRESLLSSHSELKRVLNFWRPRKTPRPIHTTACIATVGRVPELLVALKSLIKQRTPFSEILVAWDGTPAPVALKFERQSKKLFGDKVRFYYFAKSAGPGRRRNQLATKAQSDWLLFFDDDNIAFDTLNRHHCTLASQFNIDMVSSSRLIFERHPRRIMSYIPSLGPDRFQGFTRGALGDTVFTIAKSVFLNLGGFCEDIRISEDYDFHVRAALEKIPWIASPSATYLYRQDRLRRSFRVDHERTILKILKHYQALTGNKWDLQELRSLRLLACPEKTKTENKLPLAKVLEMSWHVAK